MVDSAEKLVRQHVRQILREDDYGGFDAYDTNSPYGASFGSEKDLYNVFIKPFTDVVDTTVGKSKELSQKTQTMAKVAFEALATSLVPALEDDYKSIFANEKAQMDKLKAQYKDVYDSTYTAFKDSDVLTAAFMYAPSALITAKVAQQAPIVTIKVLNALTGGRLDNFLAKVSKKLHLGDEHKPLDKDTGPGLPEGLIREQQPEQQQAKPQPQNNVGKILTQKKIMQIIDQDPKTSKMKQSTKAIIDGSLKKVLQRAQAVSTANSVEDLQTKLGLKLKGVDKLQQVPQQERQGLEAPLLKGLKRSALSLYVKGLEDQLAAMTKAGVPNNHPLVATMNNVVSKIKAMA